MKRIINITTGKTIWRGNDYLVDGQPGVVESPLVLLTEVTPDAPDYDPATQRLSSIADHIDGATYVRGAVEAVSLTAEEIAAVAAAAITEISKLTLMRRLSALGKWSAFKTLLAQLPETTQDAWTLAQAIRADDPLFAANAQTIKAALNLTDEQFDALLM
jgi:hypothetical protein